MNSATFMCLVDLYKLMSELFKKEVKYKGLNIT